MSGTNKEIKIAKLLAKQQEIEAQLQKAQKAQEEELMALCWRELKPHVITREDALTFKRAIQDRTILELLFEKKLLPEKIQEAKEERTE